MTGNFMNEYIEKLNRESNITKYNELEEYAKENKVPIIQYDSLIYLLTIIRLKKVTRIFEIVTAIAYSSLQMANMSDDIIIDTIEYVRNRNSNIELIAITQCKMNGRIIIIPESILDVDNIINITAHKLNLFPDFIQCILYSIRYRLIKVRCIIYIT